MFNKQIKKTIFVVNVDDYAPEIIKLTRPFLSHYAQKIGAEVFEITERKFPELPPVMEKLQIYELGQKMQNDWNIYIDSDALIHPEMLDFTLFMNKDTVAHNGTDFSPIRWKHDRFFWRDGRNIGSCNWFTIASDWCIELWKPIDDLTKEEILDRIYPTVTEANGVITPEHLMDDFALSRNIAKYGLKVTKLIDLGESLLPGSNFLWHAYDIPMATKITQMKQVIRDWNVFNYLEDSLKHEISVLPETPKPDSK